MAQRPIPPPEASITGLQSPYGGGGFLPAQDWYDYLRQLDIANLKNAANDAAAAALGVAIGQLYRNGSVVMVRVA